MLCPSQKNKGTKDEQGGLGVSVSRGRAVEVRSWRGHQPTVLQSAAGLNSVPRGVTGMTTVALK